ncbi:MAG: GntR family transcriptional regulator [Clostridiales bacterium]|nr:GntR family transcriptional regulator [Clostridiales bacterium]
MDIIISNASGKPIYEQIVSQIKQLILSNALQAGDALPSMRLLAKDLRISVITTKRAYEELEREGFIETIVGKGSFVASKNEDFLKEEQLRLIEGHLHKATALARQCGIAEEELASIIHLLYQEDI